MFFQKKFSLIPIHFSNVLFILRIYHFLYKHQALILRCLILACLFGKVRTILAGILVLFNKYSMPKRFQEFFTFYAYLKNSL